MYLVVSRTEDLDELRSRLFSGGKGPRSELELHIMNEELRAACMAEEGFEYVPLPFEGAIGSARFDETLDPDEFAAEYGLGISTLREDEELASAVNAATWVNPNEAITSVMAPEELLAYQVALYGPAAGDGSDSEDGSGYQPAGARHGRWTAECYQGGSDQHCALGDLSQMSST